MIHQELDESAFSARDSILPHVITSTGRPIPIKLRVDSATIPLRTFITAINIMAGIKAGIRCFRSTCRKPPPIHFDAMTYSLFLSCRTSLLTIFAILIQLVIPVAKEILSTLASPSAACSMTTDKSPGTLSSISARRIISASSHAGAQPLAAP